MWSLQDFVKRLFLSINRYEHIYRVTAVFRRTSIVVRKQLLVTSQSTLWLKLCVCVCLQRTVFIRRQADDNSYPGIQPLGHLEVKHDKYIGHTHVENKCGSHEMETTFTS